MSRFFVARTFFVALLTVGAVALALSFALEPTPDDYVRDVDGHRVRIDAMMHAVDYLIIALRVGGVIALVSGGYLTYRSLRPDRIDASDGLHGHWHDPYEGIPPEGGNPGSRQGIG